MEEIYQLYPDLSSGADRDRTGGLCSAIAALSQLSYSPKNDSDARRRWES